jgi:flagellar hook-associated protein 1 FlgK
MGSLLTAISTAAESMRTVQRAIDITGNNVLNAKTPGFAKQSLTLLPREMNIEGGLGGGLASGPQISYRAQSYETAVQDGAHQQGRYSSQTQLLSQLEPIFDISGETGIGASIDKLFEGFSLLSVTPNDQPVRQDLLERANDLANAFGYASDGLGTTAASVDRRLAEVVAAVNRVGAEIQSYNQIVQADISKANDSGLDAQIHQQLEDLAQYVDFDVLRRDDQSLQINVGGQVPLVIGSHLFELKTDVNGNLRDAQDNDLAGIIGGGQLRGVLDVRNSAIPALRADLAQLATSLAASVNDTLRNGLNRNGDPPALDLFTVTNGKLDVTEGFTADQLAAASATAPGGNGNALELAALGTRKHADLGNLTFSQSYGYVAGKAGRWLNESRAQESTHSSLLTQAQNLRADASGVSLDEEAANLIAFQRAYQATAELIRVLNSLTETTINIIR